MKLPLPLLLTILTLGTVATSRPGQVINQESNPLLSGVSPSEIAAAKLSILKPTKDTKARTPRAPRTAQSKIVGGTTALESDYPWIVSLQSSFHFCGGTLISPTHVLTASHCVDTPSQFFVEVGRYRLNDAEEEVFHRVNVKRVIKHVCYDGGSSSDMSYDLAIVELNESVSNPTIKLYDGLDATVLIPGTTEVTVAGWGDTKEFAEDMQNITHNNSPTLLQHVDIPLIGNEQCNGMYGGGITDVMMCAAKPGGGVDSCQGDSGGPLFVDTGSADKPVHVQVGVVSFGIGCALPEYAGVYAAVGTTYEWINGVINGEDMNANEVALGEGACPMRAEPGLPAGTEDGATWEPPVADNEDCSGIMFTDQYLEWVGDDFCDDENSEYGVNLNCEAYQFDNGDCTGTTPPGPCTQYSCADPTLCVDGMITAGWIGDAYCDLDLNCEKYTMDGGDCADDVTPAPYSFSYSYSSNPDCIDLVPECSTEYADYCGFDDEFDALCCATCDKPLPPTVQINDQPCPLGSVVLVSSCEPGAPHFDAEGSVCANDGEENEAYCVYDVSSSACAYCDTRPDEVNLECAWGCPSHWITDGVCDSACMNEDCNFDGGDCDGNMEYDACFTTCVVDETLPECDAATTWTACVKEHCAATTLEHYTDALLADIKACSCGDEEACDSLPEDDDDSYGYCAPGCPSYWITDSICDSSCYNEACQFDGGDCDGQEVVADCAPGCPAFWITDSYCDDSCNNAECNFDGGDCEGGGGTTGYCAPNCPGYWISDGYCDDSCNNVACGFDGTDCSGGSVDDSAQYSYGDLSDVPCEWVVNNYNYAGEISVGYVQTHQECIDKVKEECPTATIANMQVGDGPGSCFCQFGTDFSEHENAGWTNWPMHCAQVELEDFGCDEATLEAIFASGGYCDTGDVGHDLYDDHDEYNEDDYNDDDYSTDGGFDMEIIACVMLCTESLPEHTSNMTCTQSQEVIGCFSECGDGAKDIMCRPAGADGPDICETVVSCACSKDESACAMLDEMDDEEENDYNVRRVQNCEDDEESLVEYSEGAITTCANGMLMFFPSGDCWADADVVAQGAPPGWFAEVCQVTCGLCGSFPDDGEDHDDDGDSEPECINQCSPQGEPETCADVEAVEECVSEAKCGDDWAIVDMMLGIFKSCKCDDNAEACKMVADDYPSGDDYGRPPLGGEAACEGHSFTQSQCAAVGCCEWDGGECWSAVGYGDCEASGPDPVGDDDDDDDDDEEDLPRPMCLPKCFDALQKLGSVCKMGDAVPEFHDFVYDPFALNKNPALQELGCGNAFPEPPAAVVTLKTAISLPPMDVPSAEDAPEAFRIFVSIIEDSLKAAAGADDLKVVEINGVKIGGGGERKLLQKGGVDVKFEVTVKAAIETEGEGGAEAAEANALAQLGGSLQTLEAAIVGGSFEEVLAETAIAVMEKEFGDDTEAWPAAITEMSTAIAEIEMPKDAFVAPTAEEIREAVVVEVVEAYVPPATPEALQGENDGDVVKEDDDDEGEFEVNGSGASGLFVGGLGTGLLALVGALLV